MSKRKRVEIGQDEPTGFATLPQELRALIASQLVTLDDSVTAVRFMMVCRDFCALALAQVHQQLSSTAPTFTLPIAMVRSFYVREFNSDAMTKADDAEIKNKLRSYVGRNPWPSSTRKPLELSTGLSELLCLLISTVANAQLDTKYQGHGGGTYTAHWYLPNTKRASISQNQPLGDIFYRDAESDDPHEILPLTAHPEIRVARMGKDRDNLKKTRKYIKKMSDRTQRAVYQAYLATPMRPIVKRAVCYAIRRDELTLAKAGPRDTLKDVVLGGRHLFSPLEGLAPTGLEDYVFYERQSNETPREKLLAVRIWLDKAERQETTWYRTLEIKECISGGTLQDDSH